MMHRLTRRRSVFISCPGMQKLCLLMTWKVSMYRAFLCPHWFRRGNLKWTVKIPLYRYSSFLSIICSMRHGVRTFRGICWIPFPDVIWRCVRTSVTRYLVTRWTESSMYLYLLSLNFVPIRFIILKRDVWIRVLRWISRWRKSRYIFIRNCPTVLWATWR